MEAAWLNGNFQLWGNNPDVRDRCVGGPVMEARVNYPDVTSPVRVLFTHYNRYYLDEAQEEYIDFLDYCAMVAHPRRGDNSHVICQ
ncbi:hypothetical protein RhiJN_25918 [Ceratobasidium sp. AG-Ba]|nr:hypothetical protein RhiJN_25918 [Ceratobasidium sp. AG-Ba]